MLYGGDKKACDDITNSTTCVEVNAKNMNAYNIIAFSLYQFTFGSDIFSRVELNQLDPIMTDLLMGTFLGLTALLMVNIFIAMLTTTFNRVHVSSKAYFLLQRASEILQLQYFLSDSYLFVHFASLDRDIEEDRYTFRLNKENLIEKLEPLKESIANTKTEIEQIRSKLDNLDAKAKEVASQAINEQQQEQQQQKSNGYEQYEIVGNDESELGQIKIEIKELESLIFKLVEKKRLESKLYNFTFRKNKLIYIYI